MTQPELASLTASSIARMVRDGDVLATEVTDAFLNRIAGEQADANSPDRLGAFVEVHGRDARDAAARIDADRAEGRPLGPLAGVPIALKDNYVRRGHHTTCGSKILKGFVSPYTATAVQRLEQAGAIPIGRTNMDEFGMGSSTEHSIYGSTKNPFDRSRTAGGSSGGSAAAVAARLSPLALGSDTGGSVRQPASMCGIPGLKPTYGRVPRLGLVAYASSLDTVAPFARSSRDLALTLGVLAGRDAGDSTSLDALVPSYAADLEAAGSPAERDLSGVRIGIPEQYFGDGLDAEVERTVRAAIQRLQDLGATPVPVSLPHTRYAVPTYYLIATAEASSNLARFDGVRYGHRARATQDEHHLDLETMYSRSRSEGFGSEVKLRILLGTFGLSSGYCDQYYKRATQVRTLIRQDFEQAFERCDVLAAPTSPFTAFPLGSKMTDPLAMYLSDVLTVGPSLAGVPALTTPCGFDQAGLPIGMQLIGPALGEAQLFRVACAYEASTGDGDTQPHHLREPKPSGDAS